MHARRRLLGDAADRLGVALVPAGMGFEARLDRGEQHFLFFVASLVQESDVALFGAVAEVDQRGGVAAVVENHVRAAAISPFEDAMGVIPVVLQALALDREHRGSGGRDGGGGVILGRIDVAGGPANVGAERLQRLDQHAGLDRHVQRAGDAGALERLRRGVFGAGGHQARHFGFGDREFLAAIGGKADVGDGVVVGNSHFMRLCCAVGRI